MTELEKLLYTKSFIDRLADGINPLDNTPIPQDELLNNVRISRCLHYTSDILRDVIQEKSNPKPKEKPLKHRKPLFYMTDDDKAGFPYSEDPIPIYELICRLNLPLKKNGCKKISATAVITWLLHTGLLYIDVMQDGKTEKLPTDDGIRLGITAREIASNELSYHQLLYGTDAQRLIVHSVPEIVSYYQTYRAEKHSAKKG